MEFENKDRAEGIKQAYLDILKRPADDGGLASYYNSPLALNDIRKVLMSSAEARSLTRREAQVIETVEPWLACGALHSPEAFARAKEIGFNRVLCFHSDEALKQHLPDGSEFVAIKPDETFGIDAVILIVKKLKEWSADPSVRVLINCVDGVTHSGAAVWLWYIHNGLEEDEAASLTQARLDGANLAASKMGPWHFEAAVSLEGF